ncbi:hypothetical protein [Glycomyces sp. L485]|nr:hypothetical protein [Glycomyces sp. L485]
MRDGESRATTHDQQHSREPEFPQPRPDLHDTPPAGTGRSGPRDG